MMKKILFPMLAAVLFSGCVSTEEKKAQELNNRRLIYALEYPGTARLKLTLDRGGDPNFKDKYGVPALVKAVALNKMEHVKMLLDRGADVNAADPDGETAVFPAVSNNNRKLLDLLISKGASVKVRGRNGKTPAMEAARLGHFDMLKYLLEKGCDINAVDDNTAGLAAYAATAPVKAIEQLKYLEKNGIKADVQNTELMGSPFLRALFFDRVKTALYLLPKMQNLNADRRMKEIGRLAVYYAIAHNRIDLLKALIDKKVELNYNEPFYYKFVKKIDVKGVYKLAARNDVIDKRYTPLMYACIFGRVDMIKLLIYSGANPMIENNEGQKAMAYAKDSATSATIKKLTKEWYTARLENKKKTSGLVIEKDTSIKRASIFDIQ